MKIAACCLQRVSHTAVVTLLYQYMLNSMASGSANSTFAVPAMQQPKAATVQGSLEQPKAATVWGPLQHPKAATVQGSLEQPMLLQPGVLGTAHATTARSPWNSPRPLPSRGPWNSPRPLRSRGPWNSPRPLPSRGPWNSPCRYSLGFLVMFISAQYKQQTFHQKHIYNK